MAASKQDFESSIKSLELIVDKLNDSNTSLEESLELFEKGIKLSKDCTKTLENARQRIILLTEKENEEINDD